MASEISRTNDDVLPLGYVGIKERFFTQLDSNNDSRLRDGFVFSDFAKKVLKTDLVEKKVKFQRGKGLAHIPLEVREMCFDFLAWIEDRNNKQILIRGHWEDSGEECNIYKPYTHRWCEEYQNRVLAKLYYVMDFLGKDCHAFMLSLTVPHGHLDYEECMCRLKAAKKKLVRKLRDWNYRTRVWFHDPHENAYAHTHMLVIGDIPEEKVQALKLWWSRQFNYVTGSYEHGLHVKQINSESSDEAYKKGSVHNVVSYLMKYLAKNFNFNSSESIPPKILVFNAVLWKTKSRLFGFTRDISVYVKKEMLVYKEGLRKSAIQNMLNGGFEPDTWVFDSAAITDDEGNVLTEISQKRSKPEIKVVDNLLYTIPAASIELPIMKKLRAMVYSGYRVLKEVGDMIEVYERKVSVL